MEKTLWPLLLTTTYMSEDKCRSYFMDSRVIAICNSVDEARQKAEEFLASKGLEEKLHTEYQYDENNKRLRVLDVIFECPDGLEYRLQSIPVKYQTND